ncbi:MAG: hypothetical protein Q9187_008600 [Circinaria calcarea]
MLRREAEWQREREAISKQIQEANTSQVIVINSDEEQGDGRYEEDDEGEDRDDDDDVDIWLSAAQLSHQLDQGLLKAPETLAPGQMIKPRRSKLPSPWRRRSRVVYSDEAAPSGNDLFVPSDLMSSNTTPTPKQAKSIKPDLSDFSGPSDFAEFEPDDESSMLRSVTFSHGRTHKVDSGTEKARPNEGREDDIDEVCEESKGHERNGDDEVEMSPDSPKAMLDKSKRHTQRITMFEEIEEVEITANVQSLVNPHTGNDTVVISEQQDISSGNAPATWLHRIKNFVPSLRLLVPRAISRSDSQTAGSKRKRSTPEPLSIYTPWTDTHYRALRTLYLAGKADPSLYPYDPSKASAYLLGRRLVSTDWQHWIQEWELGLVEAFLDMLDEEGVDDWIDGVDREGDRPGERRVIEEQEVLRRLFSLLAGEVMEEEAALALTRERGRDGEAVVRSGGNAMPRQGAVKCGGRRKKARLAK